MKIRISVAALAAAALVAAGCGSSSTDAPKTSAAGKSSTMTTHMEHTAVAGKGGVDTGASSLRASLTAGLQEHVYLAGIAVDNGVTHGLTSPQFKAAAATLDKNSVALSQAIGGIYG